MEALPAACRTPTGSPGGGRTQATAGWHRLSTCMCRKCVPHWHHRLQAGGGGGGGGGSLAALTCHSMACHTVFFPSFRVWIACLGTAQAVPCHARSACLPAANVRLDSTAAEALLQSSWLFQPNVRPVTPPTLRPSPCYTFPNTFPTLARLRPVPPMIETWLPFYPVHSPVFRSALALEGRSPTQRRKTALEPFASSTPIRLRFPLLHLLLHAWSGSLPQFA